MPLVRVGRKFDSCSRIQAERLNKYEKGGIFTTETVTVASLITTGVDAITPAMGAVWNLMTSNPLLIVFVSASVISLGFRFFRKARRTAG